MSKRRKFVDIAAGLLFALMIAPATSKAGVIFSSFGPGATYTCCGGLDVGFGNVSQIAAAFTPSTNYALTQIDLGIYKWAQSGTEFVFNLTLNQDSGNMPGSVMQSWLNLSVPNTPAVGTASAIATVVPLGTVNLLAGHQYWLVASPIDLNTSVLWNAAPNSSAEIIEFTNSVLGGVWSAPATGNAVAFDVQGSAPEPSTIVLIPAGLAALLLIRKRRFFSH